MSDLKVDGIIASTGTNTNLTLQGKGSGKVDIGDGALSFPDADGDANQVIKTDGSGALSFVTPAADDNGWEFLELETASTSSSLTFSHVVATGYDYMITMRNMKSSGDTTAANAPYCQYGTGGGPTFITASYRNQGWRQDTTVNSCDTSGITAGALFWTLATMGGAVATELWNADMIWYDPGSGDIPYMRSTFMGENSSGEPVNGITSSEGAAGAVAITAFKVVAISTTWTTGEARLWRRKLS